MTVVEPVPSEAPAATRSPGRPPARPLSAARTLTAAAAATFALLAVWVVVYLVLFSSLQQARAQHELYTTLRAQLAQATAPIGGVIPVGRPVAVLDVPAAGVRGQVVVEGTTSGALRSGPGHLRSTPLPGQPGASVVYGRSLSFGAPFGKLAQLRVGAPITVTTDQGRFRFAVTDVRHAGDTWHLPAPGAASITLVTSTGGWLSDRVVYVDAALQGHAAADPGLARPAVSAAERAMAGESDPLTVVEVVLWLQLLVAVACGLTWLRTRWSAAQLWLVALPAVLAVLWGLSQTASRLLPNLL